MRLKLFKNGALTTFEKLSPSGLYVVMVRRPNGDVEDLVRVDTYREALHYLRSFNAIAKGL